MIIVYLRKLNDFGERHANARNYISTWTLIVKKAVWENKQDVLRDFPRAKMIQNNRARFEIAHNTFRLVAEIDYEKKLVVIRFIGTHSEYDNIDPATI